MLSKTHSEAGEGHKRGQDKQNLPFKEGLQRQDPEQWYNNYLITYGKGKERKRAELFRKLFEIVEPYQINTIAEVETVRNIITKIVES